MERYLIDLISTNPFFILQFGYYERVDLLKLGKKK